LRLIQARQREEEAFREISESRMNKVPTLAGDGYEPKRRY